MGDPEADGATARGSTGGPDPTEVRPAANEAGPPLRAAALYALKVFLVVRVALFVLGFVVLGIVPIADGTDVPGRDAEEIVPGAHNLVEAWARWDALWYLKIADEGYDAEDGSAAFFPLYPLVVRAFTPLFAGEVLLAGLFVANAAAYAALFLLYLLSAHEGGHDRARRSVLYLSAFPTAFFLYAPYSESLFLALALAAFLAARRGAWVWAGTAGALAAATRSLGVLLVLALAVEALHQAQERGRLRGAWRTLPWAALPLAGLGAYVLWWWMKAGEPLAPFMAQDSWSREATFPLFTPFLATKEAFDWVPRGFAGVHQLDWLVVMPALAAAVWVALRMRPSYAVYVWTSLIVALTFIWEPRPFMSVPRFVLVLFPIYWAGAAWAERRPGLHAALLGVSAFLLGIMVLLFVNWYPMF